jgi:hypothetical protein
MTQNRELLSLNLTRETCAGFFVGRVPTAVSAVRDESYFADVLIFLLRVELPWQLRKALCRCPPGLNHSFPLLYRHHYRPLCHSPRSGAGRRRRQDQLGAGDGAGRHECGAQCSEDAGGWLNAIRAAKACFRPGAASKPRP